MENPVWCLVINVASFRHEFVRVRFKWLTYYASWTESPVYKEEKRVYTLTYFNISSIYISHEKHKLNYSLLTTWFIYCM